MKRKPYTEYLTKTGELTGAAFYYAEGLRFKTVELSSPEGKGGVCTVSYVFAGGPEVEELADEFQKNAPPVSFEELRVFIAELHRRMQNGSIAEQNGLIAPRRAYQGYMLGWNRS